MGVTQEDLYKTIQEKLQATYLQVSDESGGCGSSFKVFIVSPMFASKGLIERQRLVNTILETEMKEIHAFQFQKTMTPEEYEIYLSKLKK
jgi:stress-induced morphogen